MIHFADCLKRGHRQHKPDIGKHRSKAPPSFSQLWHCFLFCRTQEKDSLGSLGCLPCADRCSPQGHTIRYLGGRRVFVVRKLFLNFFWKKTIFFLRSTSDNFFLCFQFFCRMLSLLCTLPFGIFSGQHISHQFRQQTFFFCPHFPQTFFWL